MSVISSTESPFYEIRLSNKTVPGAPYKTVDNSSLLHLVAFSRVASLFVIGVENRIVGVDNSKFKYVDNRKRGGRQQ